LHDFVGLEAVELSDPPQAKWIFQQLLKAWSTAPLFTGKALWKVKTPRQAESETRLLIPAGS